MYLCYQDKVNEIVLNNLPLNKVYIQIVLAMMMFSIMIIYPVVLFPAFIIIESIFFKGGKSEKLKRLTLAFPENSQILPENSNSKTIIYENILRIFIVICTIVVGIVSINRFDTMLALVGCGVCTPVALIFPSVFHYLLYKDKQSKLRSFCDISVAVIGVTLSLTILFFTVFA